MQKYCSDQARKRSLGRGPSMYKGPEGLVRSDCCRSFLEADGGGARCRGGWVEARAGRAKCEVFEHSTLSWTRDQVLALQW